MHCLLEEIEGAIIIYIGAICSAVILVLKLVECLSPSSFNLSIGLLTVGYLEQRLILKLIRLYCTQQNLLRLHLIKKKRQFYCRAIHGTFAFLQFNCFDQICTVSEATESFLVPFFLIS